MLHANIPVSADELAELVKDEELDVLQFKALCADARAALRAGQWEDASAAAEQALGLWLAAPLA